MTELNEENYIDNLVLLIKFRRYREVEIFTIKKKPLFYRDELESRLDFADKLWVKSKFNIICGNGFWGETFIN